MGLTINTNISSIVAQKNLTKATSTLNNAIERMTTGYKINHAGDNAAGYSIARNWETQLGSLDVAADNAAMGADLLSTLEDNYALISSHLQRVRDLTEQAANGTYGLDSKTAIESEIKARLDEIDRIKANCKYNDIGLMSTISGGLNIQVGLGSDTDSRINLDEEMFNDASIGALLKGHKTEKLASTNTKDLTDLLKSSSSNASLNVDTGLSDDTGRHAIACACAGLKYNGGTFQDQTDANFSASNMLAFLDQVIKDVSTRTTKLGAAQNRIDSAIESIDVQSQNITSSLSTLRDADIAKESSKYIQAQILQQAASTLLATANQTPSIALNLL